jgi:hypothetical protein
MRSKLTCRKHRHFSRFCQGLLDRYFIFSVRTTGKKEEVVKRNLMTTRGLYLNLPVLNRPKN